MVCFWPAEKARISRGRGKCRNVFDMWTLHLHTFFSVGAEQIEGKMDNCMFSSAITGYTCEGACHRHMRFMQYID